MKKVKIAFVDGYHGFKPEDSFLYGFLTERFGAELSDDPDYLLCQPFGFSHLKYEKPVKIFFTGENVFPDFNYYDYAIGFDHLDFGDRYLRVPLYAVRAPFKDFRNLESLPSKEQLLDRRFCSFVVSNGQGAHPIRQKFFEELSRYKPVDSGGRYMNNIGGPVEDKQSFVRAHKFNIAFESSSYPGYVTEKIMDAYAGWSVPIYWGDPMIDTDFRSGSFIKVRDEDDIKRAIDEVVRLDTNDDLYLKMCLGECLSMPSRNYIDEMECFFRTIFAQDLNVARRRAEFGYNGTFYRNAIKKAFAAKETLERPKRIIGKIFRSVFR